MKHPTVGEYMTTDVVSLRPEAGFKEIVRALAERGVSGAPVVDADGRVLGVVSEADLLHKEEFTSLIEVADGVVTLSGQVELKTLIPIAVSLTRAVDGVVDVVDELTYAVDDTTAAVRRYPRC